MVDKAGVYCLKNKKDNKKYIGSSKHIANRLLEHITQLENHTHSNKALQEAFDSDGLECIILEYIDNPNNKEAIIACEQKWINFYNTTDESKGYNKVNPTLGGVTASKKGKVSPSPKWFKVLEEIARCDTQLYRVWRIIKATLFY